MQEGAVRTRKGLEGPEHGALCYGIGILPCRPVVLTLEPVSESPGGLIKQTAGPTPRVSHSQPKVESQNAFLTSFQVILMLLERRKRSENCCIWTTGTHYAGE